jgi:CheY-like chemotaxis protein
MNKQGEILIVDDDPDDAQMICDAAEEIKIPNKCVILTSAEDTLAYLRKVDSDPFFIICDFRMPRINGLELKQMIQADENLIRKAIPFILFSTSIDSNVFNLALSIGVQGFYVKPATFTELQELLQTIYTYLVQAVGNKQ